MRTGTTTRVVMSIAILAAATLAFAGNLNPPLGPITGTFKTLTEVEPRTPIESLSGAANATYVIPQPGSYYLTKDLTGEVGKHGILIQSDNVTVDLNGFSLIGVAGADAGITATTNYTGLTIRNGTISGWGFGGVQLGLCNASQVIGVNAIDNTQIGIHMGTGCAVIACTARTNTDRGISAGRGSTISQCSAAENAGDGFWAGPGVTLLNCGAYANTGHGFYTTAACTFSTCTAWDNGLDGIHSRDQGSVIADCVTYQNGGVGILAPNSLIRGNASGANTGLPIDGVGATLVENHTY